MPHDVVGREPELAEIAAAIVAAAEGSPSVVLLAGDPGIGKSTLLAEAVRRAGVPAFVGRCVHVGGEALPLAPLVDLLRQVQRRVDGRAQTLAASLQPESARTMDVFELALELVESLSDDGPVVVGFEDLHWADPGSWDLFDYLAHNLTAEQAVLVGTYRPNEVSRDPALLRRVAELARLPVARRITLGGLDRHAVAVHAAAVLGIPAPPSLVDDLMRRGEGNPFFTEELAAAHLAGDAIPALLSDLLAADIAALSPAARQVVGAIAAVGRDTDPVLLDAIVKLDETTTEAAVREALETRVLVVDAGTDAYRTRHPLFGEVAYAALLPTERRRLHRLIAETLRNDPRLALTESDAAGELAFHLDRAGDEAAAFDALLDAADAAEAIAPATCLAHLERAFALWDAHGAERPLRERIDRLWVAADILSAVGDNARAAEVARGALALGPPPHGVAWGQERLGRYLWSQGAMTEAVAAYREAASLAQEERDAAAASAFAGLAQADLMFCDFGGAERWSRLALEVSAEDDWMSKAMALRVLGAIEVLRGQVESGLARCREAVARVHGAHRRSLATAYLGMALVDAGRPGEAVTLSLDGAAEAQRQGFEASFGAFLLGAATHALVHLGRWSDADDVLRSAAGVEPMAIAAVGLDSAAALLAARRGDTETAAELTARLVRLPTDPWHEAWVLEAVAEFHVAARSWDAAIETCSRALAPPAGRDVRWPARFTALLTIATVERTLDALAAREPVDLQHATDELSRRIQEAGDRPLASGPVENLHKAVASAELTRLTGGDPGGFARAAAEADALGDAWTAAAMRLREADAAAAAGSAARAVTALRSAHETATRLGAKPLLRDIDALSRRARINVAVAPALELDDHDATRLGLTPRETEVLSLVAVGRTNREIGAELYVSEKTASVHVSNILRKLGVTTRVEAAAVAQRLGVA